MILDGFASSLLADSYSGYEAVRTKSDGTIIRRALLAHARREVFNARDNHPAHATMLLAMLQELYDIEDRAKPLSPPEWQHLRHAEARLIWTRMQEHLASEAVSNVMRRARAVRRGA